MRRPVESALPAAVGVDHEPVAVFAALGGHPDRVEHQERGLGVVDRPANHEAGERVEDHAAVHLSLAGRVLRDVGHPQLVRAIAPERAPDQVQRAHLRHAGSPRQPPRRESLDPQLPHDQLHRVMPDQDLSAVTQFRGHPQRAIRAARRLMHVGDLAGQPDPPQRPRRVGPTLPRVIPGLGHAEHPTGVAHVDPLPGQRHDHREEPFGLMPSLRNTSLILRATASSVSSCLIRRFATASSSC